MGKIKEVIKRDGRIVPFELEKIEKAIEKALRATNAYQENLAKRLAEKVLNILERDFEKGLPGVEDIQDRVEKVLIEEGYAETAKAYILYRQERSKVREIKTILGVKDDLKLKLNAITVLRNRYLLRNEEGEIIETPKEMFYRVAKTIGEVDKLYKEDEKKTIDEFFQIMCELKFLPNSPTLMNAGTELGQLSACFVLPIEDSMVSIFETLKNMALIHQSGGGTGFSFSKIRPKGDIVKTTKGIASGPVSFMKVYDAATEVIKQGGKRRGANMGILNYNHPDILEFITAKSKEGVLTNFNISVAVSDEFMEKVLKNEEYELINPRNNRPVACLKAKNVFDLIVTQAWATGDPGLIFIDEINRHNPTPQLGKIEATNPCGEQPLLPYESCNLGSINLAKLVKYKNGEVYFDWEEFKRIIHLAVHFLDNVIDVNKYPIKEIETITKGNRKIGLGIMGFADMLIKLRIPYDSEEGLIWAERVAKFLTEEARKKSCELGEKRGSFPNFEKSIYYNKFKALRNATVTTIAPTGTLSIIAGCSSGIEPIFALSYVRQVMGGLRLFEIQEDFEKILKERNLYSNELIKEIAQVGSIKDFKNIPEDIRKIFVTAMDISPIFQVKIQAAFQKYIDNAVSKTVNLPSYASLEDVREVFLTAWQLKCKGITVFRYGSKKEQVLYIAPPEKGEFLTIPENYSGPCPTSDCVS
ncbi:MAG: adenosylcobalamin-dependent ribonucleoside-diphosphate reductase [candidate division WOR-3 bacterium]|nr:adenosylcobalamin-dependent ribonucleoside-diphosphate reductase [candidate division WOR-3 bacterium]MCX7836976.1 adenosylcobalamin-dependent ribonucleoside-diphosphate reductase [candidate division WOR-3 bacterium]MDW8114104.1 adenosylcobalamin-dependent ribonucleoside-diphosphate reductase [candidate division WOR-3 bacterium]